MEKEFYQVFGVDLCASSYAMEEALIGAKDKDDLISKLPEILKKRGHTESVKRIIKQNSGDYYPRLIENVYTDKPYEVLDTYAYYE